MILPVLPNCQPNYVKTNSNNKPLRNCENYGTQRFDRISFTSNEPARLVRIMDKQGNKILYAGARPLPEQMEWLKWRADKRKLHIIDLSTEGYNTNIFPEGYTEEAKAKELGIKYHRIPIADSSDIDDKTLIKFFKIVDDIDEENKSISAEEEKNIVYIHCLEGKDRTPFFATLFLMKKGMLENDAEAILWLVNNYHRCSYTGNLQGIVRAYRHIIKPARNEEEAREMEREREAYLAKQVAEREARQAAYEQSKVQTRNLMRQTTGKNPAPTKFLPGFPKRI